jgi:hypothetical protein
MEITFAVGVVMTISAAAVPLLQNAAQDFRTVAAVRYVASRLQEARAHAVKRSANAAVRFSRVDDHYVFALYVDGNGDGVRTQDIAGGFDPQLREDERLSWSFPGVDFGALPGIPPPDPNSASPGTDPIRIGSSNLLAFGPLGTATPGSLYIVGYGRSQYVIRVLGETGRVRILKFHARARQWRSL